MTVSLYTTGTFKGGVEAVVNQMVEKAADIPVLRFRDLFDQLYDLRKNPLVVEHIEAKLLIEQTITLIDARSPREPLPREEHRFYNHASQLVDALAGKINVSALTMLREIVFRDATEVDSAFDAYRTAIIQKHAFERELVEMRSDIAKLSDRLDRYMTMHPIDKVRLGTGTGTYTLPENIPVGATHVLLYCSAATGAHGGYADYRVNISNSIGQGYSFFYKSYNPQNAWSYNSENIWIEICQKRQIIVSGADNRFCLELFAYK